MEYEEEESGKATKPDGFVGERMTVLPKDVVAKYAENVFVKRLYLTDVGYFPDAKGHFIDRPDGVDEYIYFFCVALNSIHSQACYLSSHYHPKD